MDRRDQPHLRPVPDVQVVEAPPVIEQVEAPPPPQARPPAPVIGLGNMPDPTGAGLTPAVTTHLIAVGGTAVTGAGVGLLAAGNLRGAGIGAGVQLTLLGLAGSVFGAGRIPTWMRVVYGVLGLGSAVGAGYLVWTRR
jgi:hypothetical protein